MCYAFLHFATRRASRGGVALPCVAVRREAMSRSPHPWRGGCGLAGDGSSDAAVSSLMIKIESVLTYLIQRRWEAALGVCYVSLSAFRSTPLGWLRSGGVRQAYRVLRGWTAPHVKSSPAPNVQALLGARIVWGGPGLKMGSHCVGATISCGPVTMGGRWSPVPGARSQGLGSPRLPVLMSSMLRLRS